MILLLSDIRRRLVRDVTKVKIAENDNWVQEMRGHNDQDGNAMRYSQLLYQQGLGVPIWDPREVRVGELGYFVHGRFKHIVSVFDDSRAPRVFTGSREVVSDTLLYDQLSVLCPVGQRNTVSPQESFERFVSVKSPRAYPLISAA